MTNDIAEKRNQCQECNRNSPSQAATPSEPADPPSCPFEQVFSDFFDFGGHHYLVAGDRLSGYTEVFYTPKGSSNSGARGLVKCLRKWFCTFGVPRQLSSDGGPEFSAEVTAEFLKYWGVSHRISSAYHAQSNGRAEVAVKAVKRLLRSNVGPAGTLDTDRFLKAMLQFRNTPDPDCGISPAQIVFGRPLRDNLLFTDYLKRAQYSQRWQDTWKAKEEALRARFIRTSEILNRHARPLPPLIPGDKCFVQNQTGQHARKWYHTGTVMEVLPHNKHMVKMDGSGRITYRNRRFLKKYTPVSLSIQRYPQGSTAPHHNIGLTKPVSTEVQEVSDPPPELEVPADAQNDLVHEPSDPVVQPEPAPPLVQPEPAPPTTPVRDHPPKREALMVRRLRGHNAPGLLESDPF